MTSSLINEGGNDSNNPRNEGPDPIYQDAQKFEAALHDSQALVSQWQADALTFQDATGDVGEATGGEGNL
jgi:hypothetical protein